MKLKFIAAFLGLTLALPAAVFAQSGDDSTSDSYGKPSPSVPMQDPSDQGNYDPGSNQGSMNQNYSNQGSMDQDSMGQNINNGSNDMSPSNAGSNDPNAGGPSYNTPAPQETNGVARISLIKGDVSTQRGDSGAWSAAALNAPVLAGDRVSTGDQARTELQLDYANTLRLAEHSQANITQLTRSQIQVQIARGMANYTVYKNSDADAEIDTPNVSIRTERKDSSFRILVTADDHTEVLVRKGEVEITTPQGGTRVGEGQFITIQGTGNDEQYKIGSAPARDDWDQWNTDRDYMIRNAISRRRTNDYYVGSEDLDGKGTWSEVPDYGQVWRPNEPADWAPYRDGRWVYEPYWGWTWVSYDSWGWAPYHYGRWMYVDNGWAWWPGPVYANPFYQPIWAPAYVSFVGWGGGLGFGFGWGWGSVGWLPLGPCDHFHPWWGRWGGGRFGAVGFNSWNRGGFAPLHGGNRFSNVNLALHDPHFRGGTTVSGREFGGGRMTGQPMRHEDFQRASFSSGRLPMTPGRESFSASGRPAAASTTRNVSGNQHFFSARNSSTNAGRENGFNSNANHNYMRSSTGERFNQNSGAERNGVERNTGSERSFGSERGTESRGGSNWGSVPRPGNSGTSTIARNNGGNTGNGWQHFSPMPSRPAEPTRSQPTARGSEPSRGESSMRGEPSRGFSSGRGEQDIYSRAPQSSEPRSSSPSRNFGSEGRSYSSPGRNYGGGYSSRQPLNMRQPIATPRSYGGGSYGAPRGYNGGSYSAPRSYSGGGRSAPSFGGGGHSAPSYHGGGGGGSSHGGGGSSHGGGGGHSSGGGGHGGGGGRHGR